MPTLSFPIVGAHFRPPAKAILACLPSGHPLELQPEPSNPYDANAIKVVVHSETVGTDLAAELAIHISGFGTTIEEFFQEPEWHLGYIPRVEAEKISLSGSVEGQLTFTAKGAPAVRFSVD